MKKTKKLNLAQNAEKMNEDEMKLIVGGYDVKTCGECQKLYKVKCHEWEGVVCADNDEDAENKFYNFCYP